MGRGWARRFPILRRAFSAQGRDPDSLQVVPFGTIPSDGKLEHYQRLGVDEVVLRVPSGNAASMQRSLDELATYVPRFDDG